MVVHMQEGDLPHIALQKHDELQTDVHVVLTTLKCITRQLQSHALTIACGTHS